MAQVAIQLSDDDQKRLEAYALAHALTPEAAATQAVQAALEDDRWLGPDSEAAYRAFVQQGIDSADRGALEDWDVVKGRLRAYMAERSAAASE